LAISFVTGPIAINAVPVAAWFKKDLRERDLREREFLDGELPVFNVPLFFIAVLVYLC